MKKVFNYQTKHENSFSLLNNRIIRRATKPIKVYIV